jgi:hypothetical protein
MQPWLRRASYKERKERITGRPTVGQSANRKADPQHATGEIDRLVNREDFDMSRRVMARAVPSRRHPENDVNLNPLAKYIFPLLAY